MAGEPIVAVNQGLQLLKNDLEGEPRAVETVWISVISFGGQAQVEVPLTELMAFNAPTLNAEGSTPLGEALRLLNRSIDNDIIVTTGVHTGDYKPLIFIFTDGDPTDDWRTPARELKQRTQAKTANIIAIGCGPSVNVNNLKEITESVMLMENATSGSFTSLAIWMSQSIKGVSMKAGTMNSSTGSSGAPPAPIDLPPPPGPGFKIVL